MEGCPDDRPVHRHPDPLSQLARRLPRKPSPATLWRWHKKGVKGVRLEVVSVGGRTYTTEAAFREFVRRQTEVTAAAPAEIPAERPPALVRRMEKAGLI